MTYTITRRHDLEVIATGLSFLDSYKLEESLPRNVDYIIHKDEVTALEHLRETSLNYHNNGQAAWAYL
jgi:hypothetical protein